MSSNVHEWSIRAILEVNTLHAQAWTYADVINIVIRWQAFGNIRNRAIGPLFSVIRTVGAPDLKLHGA
jgi:hypothetical protein